MAAMRAGKHVHVQKPLTHSVHEAFPRSTIVRYQFPARSGFPPLKLTWWDGGMMPARPDGSDADEPLGDSDAGPLSITVLMGNLAVRFPNQHLLWDGEHMRVTHDQEDNALVTRKYREGWSL